MNVFNNWRLPPIEIFFCLSAGLLEFLLIVFITYLALIPKAPTKLRLLIISLKAFRIKNLIKYFGFVILVVISFKVLVYNFNGLISEYLIAIRSKNLTGGAKFIEIVPY